MKRNIQSLVGYFHLDPNRVCDIVLDAWEVDLTNGGYKGLLRLVFMCLSVLLFCYFGGIVIFMLAIICGSVWSSELVWIDIYFGFLEN